MASFRFREQLLLPRLKLLHTCASRSLSLEAALEGVLHSRGPVAGRRFSARFLQGLKAGRGVVEALREADPAQPGMVLSLVAVGERTGQLALCTRYLVDYYERVAELRRSLSRALTYPLIVLVFIWISLGVFDGVIRGVFESLYASAELGLPPSLSGLFRLIHGLFLAPLVLLPLLGLAGWLARLGHIRLPGLYDMAGRISPRLVQRIELDRLFYTLHVALSGGLELAPAFTLAYQSVRGKRLRRSLGAVHVAIERGASLHDALERTRVLEAQELGLIRLGEQTGDLQGAFAELSRDFRVQVEDRLQHLQDLLQPALVVFLGVVVLLLLVLLYRPLFLIGDLL